LAQPKISSTRFLTPLAYLVTFVPGGAGVYAGTAFSGFVLGDMGCYVAQPAKGHEFEGVVAFISAKGYSFGAGQALIQHFKRCFPLRSAGGSSQFEVHKQPIAVFHQGVQAIGKLGFLAFALAHQQGFGISSGGVSAVFALLALEINAGIARIIGRVFSFGFSPWA
jgi:hypothetical protein